MTISRSIMEEVCRLDSDNYFRFTKADFAVAKQKHPQPGAALTPRKEKRKCCVNGCEGFSVSRGLCSTHYQRKRAKDRGYWISGGGRIGKLEQSWKKKPKPESQIDAQSPPPL